MKLSELTSRELLEYTGLLSIELRRFENAINKQYMVDLLLLARDALENEAKSRAQDFDSTAQQFESLSKSPANE